MAEIHVEPRKKTTPVWIWIVIALLVLGLIAYVLLRNKQANESNVGNKPNPTSYIRDAKALPFYV